MKCRYKPRAGMPACTDECAPDSNKCHYHSFAKHDNGKETDWFGNALSFREVRKPTREQMSYLDRHIGPKLKDLMQDALAVQEFDISTEVAATRAANVEIAKFYSDLLELFDVLPNDDTPASNQAREAHRKLLMEATHAFKAAQDDVTKQIERQAKIHAMVADKFSPNAVKGVVQQITRMVHDTFHGENYDEMMQAFNKKLNEELKLPSLSDYQGTNITPDMEVLLMDQTIPPPV